MTAAAPAAPGVTLSIKSHSPIAIMKAAAISALKAAGEKNQAAAKTATKTRAVITRVFNMHPPLSVVVAVY